MTTLSSVAPVAGSSPAVPVVTNKDRYLFDLQGFLLLRGALAEEDRLALLDEVERMEKLDHDDTRWNPPGSGVKPENPTKMDLPGLLRLNGLLRMNSVFDRCIDYPTVIPYLYDFMPGAQLVNSWSITKYGPSEAGQWHAGLGPDQYGFHNGRIVTKMVNTVFFLSDNGPDDGCMGAIPGSHKANYYFDYAHTRGLDVPGAVPIIGKAGDILIFTESLQHNGMPKTSDRKRTNLYYNHVYTPTLREGHPPSIANFYHYAMPPHVRERFTARQKSATAWMEFVRTID